MTDREMSPSRHQTVEKKPLIFRIYENGPEALREVLLERGWEEFIEGQHADHEWNLYWRGNRFRASDHEDVMHWQRLNHFPKTVAITRKDMLARNMRRMRGVYGASVYNFTPQAFNLPNDYTKFVAEYTRSVNQQQEEQQEANATGEGHLAKRDLWICKPADLSRGRGIFIFQDLSELTYDSAAVAQKYITNPMLIAGYKFDLRIYVLVTSFHPLNIYVYQEGIVRFSTEKFDLTSIDNLFAHLTNTSINKLGPSYTSDKERIGPGCKWSLTTLRNYFHQQNIDDEVLWQRIHNIITWTMLAQAPTVPKVDCCYELFGFDVLIDTNLKPWLLEVNFSPALSLDCATDYNVKKPMLSDLTDLLGFKDSDGERGGESFKKLTRLKQKHSHGFNRTNKNMGNRRPQASRLALRKSSVPPDKRVKPPAMIRSSSLPVRANAQSTRSKNINLKTASQNSSQSSIQSPSRSLSNDSIGRYQRMSSKSSSNDDICDDDYETERAAACSSKSSSETKLNEKQSGSKLPTERRSRLSLPPRRISSQHALPNVRAGSLDSMALPSVDESRNQLQRRREEMRQRKEQNLNSPSPVRFRTLGKAGARNLNDDSPSRKASGHSQSRIPQNQNAKGRSSQSQLARSGTDVSKRDASGSREATQIGNRDELNNNTASGQQKHQSATAGSKSTVQKLRKDAASRSLPRKQPPSYLGGKKADLTVTDLNAIPTRVGDFALTFPFNDATRRACYPTLDIRTIIRETQKQLRRTICKATSTKKRVATTTAYKVPINKGVLRGSTSWGSMNGQMAASNGRKKMETTKS